MKTNVGSVKQSLDLITIREDGNVKVTPLLPVALTVTDTLACLRYCMDERTPESAEAFLRGEKVINALLTFQDGKIAKHANANKCTLKVTYDNGDATNPVKFERECTFAFLADGFERAHKILTLQEELTAKVNTIMTGWIDSRTPEHTTKEKVAKSPKQSATPVAIELDL